MLDILFAIISCKKLCKCALDYFLKQNRWFNYAGLYGKLAVAADKTMINVLKSYGFKKIYEKIYVFVHITCYTTNPSGFVHASCQCGSF